MRHAYLVMAHEQPELLRFLLERIDSKDNDIIIHFDVSGSVSKEDIDGIIKKSNVYYADPIKVQWGGYSQIQAEINCLKKALEIGSHDYYHLLSGVDLPLKHIDEINSFYSFNEGKEFIQYFSKLKSMQEYEKRFAYKSVFREKSGRNRNFYQALNKLTLGFQQVFRIYDSSLKNEFYLGSSFWDITEELAVFIVSKEAEIQRKYRNSSCCDEAFIQTMIYGTKFYDNLFVKCIDNGMKGNMRYIDFFDEFRGSPHTITENDIEKIVDSGMMFARKFDVVNNRKAIDKLICILDKEK